MRILLAEDDKSINRVIVRRLKWEGYSVDTCFDGQEALDYLAVVEYDAVILDVMMPRVDGFEVLTLMRTVSGELGITMILVTHDLGVAEQADRIIRLEDGRVAGDSSDEAVIL